MYYCIHKFLQNWINLSLWYVHIKYTSTSSNISTSNTFIFVQLFPLQRFTISVCLSNGMCVLAWRRQRRCFTGIWYTRIEWVSLSLFECGWLCWGTRHAHKFSLQKLVCSPAFIILSNVAIRNEKTRIFYRMTFSIMIDRRYEKSHQKNLSIIQRTFFSTEGPTVAPINGSLPPLFLV